MQAACPSGGLAASPAGLVEGSSFFVDQAEESRHGLWPGGEVSRGSALELRALDVFAWIASVVDRVHEGERGGRRRAVHPELRSVAVVVVRGELLERVVGKLRGAKNGASPPAESTLRPRGARHRPPDTKSRVRLEGNAAGRSEIPLGEDERLVADADELVVLEAGTDHALEPGRRARDGGGALGPSGGAACRGGGDHAEERTSTLWAGGKSHPRRAVWAMESPRTMNDDDEPTASGVLPIGPRTGRMLAAEDVGTRFSRLFHVAAALGGAEFPATLAAALEYAGLTPAERAAFLGPIVRELPGDGLGLALLLPLVFVEDDPLQVARMTKSIWEAVERNQATMKAWAGSAAGLVRGCRLLIPLGGGASELVEIVYDLEDGFRSVRERALGHDAEVGASLLLVVVEGILLEPAEPATVVADLITTVLAEARYRRESVFEWKSVCELLLDDAAFLEGKDGPFGGA